MSNKERKKLSKKLQEQLSQEVNEAESEGMEAGYACSKHKHIIYDVIIPFYISESVWFLGNCDGESCDGKITRIPVQLARIEPIANGVRRRVVKTKDQSGKWIEGEGEAWKEYSKNVYSKSKTD
ncbi:hypothetical protein DER44DRAFT_190029 [Fusarium oxysporum]|nr:hypothetical protein DER44DRAFT_190029 [Fusarium oxysporum]